MIDHTKKLQSTQVKHLIEKYSNNQQINHEISSNHDDNNENYQNKCDHQKKLADESYTHYQYKSKSVNYKNGMYYEEISGKKTVDYKSRLSLGDNRSNHIQIEKYRKRSSLDLHGNNEDQILQDSQEKIKPLLTINLRYIVFLIIFFLIYFICQQMNFKHEQHNRHFYYGENQCFLYQIPFNYNEQYTWIPSKLHSKKQLKLP